MEQDQRLPTQVTSLATPSSVASTLKQGKTKEELAKLRKEMMKRKKSDPQQQTPVAIEATPAQTQQL